MPGGGCLPAVTEGRRDGGQERTYRRCWPVARKPERRMMTAETGGSPGLLYEFAGERRAARLRA
jgi:hypothetical protein